MTRCSSPLRTKSRERKSIQTDWPRAAIAARRDSGIPHSPFHRRDLLEPGDVALAAVEAGGEEALDELARDRRSDDLRAEAEHVDVVVLDRLVGAVEVVADRRPDPPH